MEATTNSPTYHQYGQTRSAHEYVNSSTINDTKTKKIIAIVGPTGIGKTKLGITVAKMLNTEVISSDSLQVYQGGDILTAKVLPHEMAGVRHHLLNCLEPWKESFGLIDSVETIFRQIHERNKIPIIVGGSTSLTIPVLFHKARPRYSTLVIILRSDPVTLETRLDDRVDEMLDKGLLAELRDLYDLEKEILSSVDYSRGIWKAIGYRELHPFLEYAGKYRKYSMKLLTDGIQNMKKSTKVYARTQIAWIDSTLVPRLKEAKVDCYSLNASNSSEWTEHVEILAVRLCRQWLDEAGTASN